MIAGEWAVLEGAPCVVAAVNKRVHSIVEPLTGNYISLTIDDFKLQDIRFTWNGVHIDLFKIYQVDAEKLKFTKESIEVALRFLEEHGIKFKPFKIRTYGEETPELIGVLKKIGFGSSAAAVVAIIASILRFHGYNAGSEEIYKLAAIAHYYAQGKAGSAFDVAASTYGGVIVYKRFDAAWLTGKIENGEKVSIIVKNKWPGFYVERLDIPDNLRLAIAWTGESASTGEMIKKMDSFKQSNGTRYHEIYSDIQRAVEALIDGWKSSDEESILGALRKNKELLHILTKESGVSIETEELRNLSKIAADYGAAGKLSGAGGGDCGFAIAFNDALNKVRAAWQSHGLHVIGADIDSEGVKAEKM